MLRRKRVLIVRSLLLILLVALAVAAPTHATTLLFDDFDGRALDLGVWLLPTGPWRARSRSQAHRPVSRTSSGVHRDAQETTPVDHDNGNR